MDAPSESVVEFGAALVRARAQLDALIGSAIAAVGVTAEAESGIGRPRHAADVLATECGADPKPLAAQSRLSTWIDGFPGFRDAYEAGDLSTDHVRALRALDCARTRTALVDAQDYLIEAAQRCTWAEFVRATRYWKLCADPDGSEPRDQVAERSCRLSKNADGTVSGQFRLDPVTGDAVANALGRAEQELFRQDAASGSSRTARQRKADALAALIVGGHAARAAGKGQAPSPLVHLVLSQRVAEQILAGDPPDLDPDDADQRCELVDGTPVHPVNAAALLAIGTLRRLVLSAKSETLDLGQAVRTFPAHLKHALLAAARGRCQVRGCDAPPPWLQADHVHPWYRDGPTATSNGQILCDPHNKAKGSTPPDDGGRGR